MPGRFTAAQLIERARGESDEWDPKIIPDGYPADEEHFSRGVSFLSLLNDGLRDLQKTGFNVCYFNIPLVADRLNYNLYRGMGEVLTAVFYDVSVTPARSIPIERTTVDELDRIYLGAWRNNSGQPTAYYFAGSGTLGFDRTPNLSNKWQISFLAHSQLNDMTVSTDIPGQVLNGVTPVLAFDGYAESVLPEQYHIALAYYAAAKVCLRSGKSELGSILWDQYKEEKEDLRKLVESRMLNPVAEVRIDRTNKFASLYRRM